MSKRVSFCFILNCSQAARTICTCTKLWSRGPTTPCINDHNKENPHNINKMPIHNCEIHGSRLSRFCFWKKNITYRQIKPSNKDVEAVKSRREVECTSKHGITKSKRRSSVFLILTIQKQNTEPNRCSQMNTHRFHISSINCMFCRIRSKITPQKKLRVGFWLPKQFNWNYTKRGPTHPNLNSWHQCPMKEPPEQTNKKHCLTPNKQHHTKMQSSFHFSSVKSKNSFTVYIAPPNKCCINQRHKCNTSNRRCTRILVKNQYHRCGQPQKTQPSQRRPRTKINQMIPMMGHTHSIVSCSRTISRILRCSPKNFFVIQNFQNH